MFQLRMPRFILLRKSIQSQDFNHSILISMLRGLAAIQVAAAHLRAQVYPGLKGLEDPTLWYQALAFFTGFAHQAVVVFFLLSGWLVGGSLLNKLHEPRVFVAYAIDRMTRLWIVLIPAFLLTLAIGAVTQVVDLTAPSTDRQNEYSAASFLGNLFGLQDMLVPRFGGNFPLWSLANETWYYVLFPILMVPFAGRSVPGRACALLSVAFLAYHLNAEILLYFPVWLLGVAFSRIQIDATRAHRRMLIATLAVVSVYFRLNGSNDKLDGSSFFQDVVFSVVFLLLLSSLQFQADHSSRLVRACSVIGPRIAAFSFTLYVVHVPFLFLLRHLFEPLSSADLSPHELGHFFVYAAMLALIILLSYLFHWPFEAQTLRVRGWIKEVLYGRTKPVLTGPAVSARRR